MNRRTFLAGTPSLFGVAPLAFADEPPKPDINRLIEQLGSKRFTERETASKTLKKMREQAWPALRTTAKIHPDPEVRRRARQLLPVLNQFRVFTGHTHSVVAVAFAPRGHWALSSALDDTVRLWDIASGRQMRVFPQGEDTVFSIAYAPLLLERYRKRGGPGPARHQTQLMRCPLAQR